MTLRQIVTLPDPVLRRKARTIEEEENKNTIERERMVEWFATYHKSAEEFRKNEEDDMDEDKTSMWKTHMFKLGFS
jgi:hypothetical protein